MLASPPASLKSHAYYVAQWYPTPVLLPGKSHGRRSLVGCSPWGHEESDMTEWLHFHFSLACIGEGNGNPLQCSCLENPRDGGAWWAAVSGVAQSRTRLKGLSSSRLYWAIRVQPGKQNPLRVLEKRDRLRGIGYVSDGKDRKQPKDSDATKRLVIARNHSHQGQREEVWQVLDLESYQQTIFLFDSFAQDRIWLRQVKGQRCKIWGNMLRVGQAHNHRSEGPLKSCPVCAALVSPRPQPWFWLSALCAELLKLHSK